MAFEVDNSEWSSLQITIYMYYLEGVDDKKVRVLF